MMHIYIFSLTLLLTIPIFAGWSNSQDFVTVQEESQKKVGNVVGEPHKKRTFDRFWEIDHGIRKGERNEHVQVVLEDSKRKTSMTYVIPSTLIEQQLNSAKKGNLRSHL